MGVQQWARAHYSSLLGELRKWEVHTNGEISFDEFAAFWAHELNVQALLAKAQLEQLRHAKPQLTIAGGPRPVAAPGRKRRR